MIWHSLLLTLTLTAAEAGGNLSPEDKADLKLLFPDETALSEKLDRWVLVTGDFDKYQGTQFQPTDPAAWRITATDRGNVFEQFAASKYQPPHRSPFNIALLKREAVEDFVFTAHLKSTTRDYGHRDMCLFFGYQDPAHFYYVHLGKKADPNSNQIMIVNDAPRTKITKKESPGTDWDDQWHLVKIVRRTADGVDRGVFRRPENARADGRGQDVSLGPSRHRLVRRHGHVGRRETAGHPPLDALSSEAWLFRLPRRGLSFKLRTANQLSQGRNVVQVPLGKRKQRTNARMAQAVPCGSTPLYTTANWPAQTRG